MPPGDAWQLLGRSLGANPTPMAYAETYTGLQTGAIDGQDNPLPNDKLMKFYEVTDQIVLTSHQRRGEYGWYSLLDGEVEMICARWYGTERDRRNAIELAELSLVSSHLAAGARPIDPGVHKGQHEHVVL